MKSRIPSTVIISVIVLMNFFFLDLITPLDIGTLTEPSLDSIANMGMFSMVGLLIVSGMVLFFIGWLLAISLTHAICLIFTIKNRKSPLKAVRIINYVLDVANVLLIVLPLINLFLAIGG